MVRTEKRCAACGETTPMEQLQRSQKGAQGRGSYCLRSTRNNHLKRRYGITAAEVEAMMAAEGGTCAICRVKPAEHVDHDHETGDVRGILCFTCNVGLGNFEDDPERLLLGYRYLTRHPAATGGAARLRLIMTRRAS